MIPPTALSFTLLPQSQVTITVMYSNRKKTTIWQIHACNINDGKCSSFICLFLCFGSGFCVCLCVSFFFYNNLLKINLFIYLFVCVASSLLRTGFL